IFLLFKRWEAPRTMREHLLSAGGILFLCYTHIHLESLSGLLFAMLLIAFLVGRWIWQRKGRTFFLGFFAVGILAISLGISLIPSLQSNLKDSFTFLMDYLKDPYGYTHLPRGEIRGNDARLILWTASAEITSQHPNGVGVGNLPAAMEAKLLQYGQVNLAKEHLNSHNQFFHTAIETGWIGLIWLIFLVVGLIFWGIRNASSILVVVTAGFAFNGLFESMLERQSGIVFWLLWSCLCLGLHRSFKTANHES
ncbi:MAG: O-antigen ligase family protein, partial [Bacteroidota bacterium]